MAQMAFFAEKGLKVENVGRCVTPCFDQKTEIAFMTKEDIGMEMSGYKKLKESS